MIIHIESVRDDSYRVMINGVEGTLTEFSQRTPIPGDAPRLNMEFLVEHLVDFTRDATPLTKKNPVSYKVHSIIKNLCYP